MKTQKSFYIKQKRFDKDKLKKSKSMYQQKKYPYYLNSGICMKVEKGKGYGDEE
jgi:hypothetical protein